MRSQASLCLLALAVAACSGGSSSNGTPAFLPTVPNGTGQVQIAMAGDWQVTDVQIVETTDPNVQPLTGSMLTLSDSEVVMVDGDPASRQAMETSLGVQLSSYVNQVNGQTILYGYRAEAQGVFLELGAAGGAVDDDHIAVEAVTNFRLTPGTPVVTVRTRYTLVRQVVPMQVADANQQPNRHGMESFFGWPQGTVQGFRTESR